ncbi:MAG: Rrf2 family transcriptional regulator [Eubacteriales bacterium]
MLLTREFDYAMCIMRALKNGEKRSVKEICGEEEIPEPFTYKILKKLEKKEIVKSIRGARGGYILARDINDLYLMDIMLAIEPVFGITECTKCECTRANRSKENCRILDEYMRIQESLIGEMRKHSLGEVMSEDLK